MYLIRFELWWTMSPKRTSLCYEGGWEISITWVFPLEKKPVWLWGKKEA